MAADAPNTTALSNRWKEYNEYETMNPHEKYRRNVKENLKREINNIAVDLAIKRDEEIMKRTKDHQGSFLSPNNRLNRLTTYSDTQTAFKTPKIEAMERSFNEGSRYFNTFKEQRIHGVKLVPPPVSENLKAFEEEQQYDESRRNME